jgi:SAM-dependent methyltransferase
MEEIRCILCHVESDSVAIAENGYTGRRCPSCGLIFISPRPSPAAIRNLYGHDQAHIPAARHIAVERLKRRHARHNLGLLRRHRRSGALLEVGAGAGYFLDEARRAGFEPHAIELNPLQARFIREELGVPCEESPLHGESFARRHFDVIYHSDILSHLPDPLGAMKMMHEKLADGGILVFETGNFADVEPRHYALIGTFQYPDHLFFFGAESLARLLAAAGFTAVETRTYSTVPQLLALRALGGLKALAGGARRGRGRGARAEPAIPPGAGAPARSVLVRRLDPAWQDLLYVLRYGAGKVAPRRGRPQTIIVVARKGPAPRPRPPA